MPIIDIWVKEDDMEILRRMKNFLEYQVEEKFEDKAWRWGRKRGKRKRIRRPRINNSHIFRQALYYYWSEIELQVIAFESKKYR